MSPTTSSPNIGSLFGDAPKRVLTRFDEERIRRAAVKRERKALRAEQNILKNAQHCYAQFKARTYYAPGLTL